MLLNDSQAATASRHPIVELLKLAIPTVVQMASYTLMQFVDAKFLSFLGDNQATSAANGGMMAFSLLSFGMGTMIIVNTLASQCFGRGEHSLCGRYLWQGIWVGLIYSVLLLPGLLLPVPMFRAFKHPADMVAMESTYFRIVLLATVVKMTSTALGQFLLAIDRPAAVLGSAIFGVGINAAAAWCIVLGHCGFNSHGVAGAAWAQNIGVTCELLMLIGLTLRPGIRRGHGLSDLRPRWQPMRLLIAIGTPSGLQWLGDILAWSLFMNWVMGMYGTVAMNADNYAMKFMSVSFMPAVGIGTAVTSLVGRYIGRGRPDLAFARTYLGYSVTAAYMLICGLLFFLFRHQLIAFFSGDPRVQQVGSVYLIYMAVYQIFDATYIIFFSGLRGAGDTLVPAIIVASLCWSINVVGAATVARYLPSLGYGGPWIAATIYGALSSLLIGFRFLRGRWTSINLDQTPASNPPGASATLA